MGKCVAAPHRPAQRGTFLARSLQGLGSEGGGSGWPVLRCSLEFSWSREQTPGSPCHSR